MSAPRGPRPAWSLIVFTVLTQAAVGLQVLRTWYGEALFSCGPPAEVRTQLGALGPTVLVLLVLGLAAATLHLGRPGAARFAILNLRSSWLSRELVLVLLFGAAVGVQVVLARLAIGPVGLGWPSTVLGVSAVLAMARVYMIRTVPAWNSLFTPVTFFVTTLMLGAAALAVLLARANLNGFSPVVLRVAGLATLLGFAQLAVSPIQLWGLSRRGGAAAAGARAIFDHHLPLLLARLGLLVLGVTLLAPMPEQPRTTATGFLIIAAVLLLAELLGRYLFYALHRRVGL